MKEVTILIPDGVSENDIFYKCKEIVACDIRFVRPFIVAKRHGVRKSEFDEEVTALTGAKYISPAPLSRKEFDALCIRVQRLELLTTSYQPSAEEGLRIVGCSDKEIEEIRSRVEKLEQESERQCARVIKMEEGISDDLK